MFELSCSIVLYKNDPIVVKNAIDSLRLQEVEINIYIYDNSPTDELRLLFDSDIMYFHDPSNVGFGRGHNFCIEKGKLNCKYHLILNPDVYFESGVLLKLIDKLKTNADFGLIAPKILYPDGRIQYSCRMLPSPVELIIRRLPIFSLVFKKWIQNRDLVFTDYNIQFAPPFILGCFMLLPHHVLDEVGGFDEVFFMYMEDIDLTRRVKKHYKTLFFPEVAVFHLYERQSVKNIKLLSIHLKSAIHYFNKWGWFLDKERVSMNSRKAINSI